MKRMAMKLSFAALTILLSHTALAAQTIAVVPFSVEGSEENLLGFALAHSLSERLLHDAELNATSVRQVYAAARHDGIDIHTLDDLGVAQSVGKLLGADRVVVGELKVDGSLNLVLLDPNESEETLSVTVAATGGDPFQLENAAATALFEKLERPLAGNTISTTSIKAWRYTASAMQTLGKQSLSPRSADRSAPLAFDDQALLGIEKELNTALSADPNYGEALAQKAILQAFRLDFDAAQTTLELLQNTNNPPVLYGTLARAYVDMRSGAHDLAVTHYSAGIDAHPGFLHARGSLGELFNHVGRRREAKSVFSAYQEREPDQPWVLVQLGYTLSKMGKSNLAIRETKRALRLLPSSTSLQIELASRYIDAKRLPDAMKVLRKASKKNPDDPTIDVRLAYVMLKKGVMPQVIKFSKAALEKAEDPRYFRVQGYAHLNLAHAYGRLRKFDEAFSHLESAQNFGALSMGDLEADPKLRKMRKDPRYQAMLNP